VPGVLAMAAGAVALAHATAGPALDIVVPFHGHRTGFLAATEAEYADALAAVFALGDDERGRLTAAARASVARFSDEEFSLAWYAGVAGLVRDATADLKARRLAAAATGKR
jgi:alpha-1,2-mannosyltransferase